MNTKTDFNTIQTTIAEQYAGGDMEHVTCVDDVDSCGDGLFAFLIGEASDVDVGAEEFRRRLDIAIDQMQSLRRYF